MSAKGAGATLAARLFAPGVRARLGVRAPGVARAALGRGGRHEEAPTDIGRRRGDGLAGDTAPITGRRKYRF